MAALIKFLPLIIKYWPVIQMVLQVIRGSNILDELVSRPDTQLPQDVRDFMRKASAKGKWQDDFWQQMQDDSQ